MGSICHTCGGDLDDCGGIHQPSGTCVNCHQREGTTTWVGDGGVMALIHGGGAWWCEQCCVEAQIAYAEKMVASLPDLKRRLIELKGGTIVGT